MTDEEIVEVVNYCQSQKACSLECPFWKRANSGSKGGDCDKRLGKVAFEFIHRLLAENGSLRNEIESIKSKNVKLRDRLARAAEEVKEIKREIEPKTYVSFLGFVVRWCTLEEHKEIYGTEKEALARLAELKGENV